jgi:hypothetical protein
MRMGKAMGGIPNQGLGDVASRMPELARPDCELFKLHYREVQL